MDFGLCTSPSIDLKLHLTLTHERDPEILKDPPSGGSFHLEEQSTFLQQSTMVSDLEVLSLITVASHSASNMPSAHRRSLSDEATEPHNLQKSEMLFCGHQTGHPPIPDCTLRSYP
ncbi:hypothetical protein LDENG_00010760 [Lucifuga dentata]|nr:hypothetical protein LDENG_00010760 [Lucifuga dentata]